MLSCKINVTVDKSPLMAVLFGLIEILTVNSHQPAIIIWRTAELLQRQSLLAAQRQQSIIPFISQPDHSALTTQQMVALIINLFQGREDIYALRWENKQGRSAGIAKSLCS